MRITDHPVLGKLKVNQIPFTFNGIEYTANKGESIASALLANHIRTLRQSETYKKPRGIYCGIGHCYECRVRVDGQSNVRACLMQVKENMQIESESGWRI